MFKLFILILSFISLHSWAQTKGDLPLWELGGGMLPFRSEHYRGAPGHTWYSLPFPAFIYRGGTLEADNSSIRSHVIRYKDLTIDISFSVGLMVNSRAAKLRKDMNDLDPTFEAGPMMRYYWWKSQNGNHFLNFEFPFRAVYATDLTYIDHVGYYSIPYLNFISRRSPDTWGWSSEISIGPQYGSTEFHDRFYGVNGEFVRPGRPQYRAKRGYSGTQFSWVISKRFKDVLVVPFFRWDYLDGAVYNDSPLYKSANYTMFGAALIWYFKHSEEKQSAPTMVK